MKRRKFFKAIIIIVSLIVIFSMVAWTFVIPS